MGPNTAMASSMQAHKLLCFSLLLFHLLSLPLLASAAGRKLSAKPGYQTLYIDPALRAKMRAGLLAETKVSIPADGLLATEIVDRNRLPSSARVNPTSTSEDAFTEAFSQRLVRDSARVKGIEERLEVARMGANTAEWKPANVDGLSQEEISSPLVSGLSQGSGEYFARFGVGTPPKESYFVIDTGSDLSWTQCAPCNSCYKQTDPIFNPADSSSYKPVSCSDALCSQLLVRGCQRNQCLYQVSYGDGSFTVGDFAVETFTFSGNQVERVALGCGHDNEGLFIGASGLLGLGAGRLSLPTQLKQEFSYCLPDRFGRGSSQLIFGRGAAPGGSTFTPLLKNARLGTFYYVQLEGISVGGSRLRIASSAFALQSSGTGGVILDSGTSITRLVASAYSALRDSFAAGASNLPSAGSFSLFDTCYALGGMSSVDVPTVELHLAGGTTLSLPAENYLIPVDTAGTYCFGFAGTNSGFSIIGNMQQQGYRISFNLATSRVGFASNQC
ncbi:hypothetical protein GOP47_0013113 [Adiantum capillus-veneris]|uniref:Peptidase A1 domain-containing protein n=1 Tax=Adiantum capillus-veneris TaxID=13818 RepID=A0A9D4USH3_ADICA|nr:hypothetical protein GOP47_0013113 [Adiantum capillus-veneris]